jgi:hypothetical protein
MADTIRDVVIRVSVENGQSTLSADMFQGVTTSAEGFTETIVNLKKEITELQQIVSATATSTAGSFGGGGGSAASAGPQNVATTIAQEAEALAEVAEAAEEVAASKDAAATASNTLNSSTGSLTLQTAEEAAAFKKQIEELRAAEAATESLAATTESSLTSSLLIWTAVGAAVVLTLRLISTALQEARDTNRRYWQEIAEDAQSAIAFQQRQSIQTIQQNQRRFGAMNIDLTEEERTPERLAAQAEREERIRREQDQLAGRPLAERQEIRSRIEGQGARQDRGADADAQIQRLEKQLEDMGVLREMNEQAIEDAAARERSLNKTREDSRVVATPLGRAFSDVTSAVGLGEGMVPDFFSNLVGETSVRDEKVDRFDREQAAAQAAKDRVAAQEAAAGALVKIQEDELKIQQQINDLKEKKLGLTREEQREARMLAEQGQEEVTNKLLQFGQADEATKASLRVIQQKADSGATLNFQEIGLANRFGIDASRQAREQSLDSANLPENIALFQKTMELQEGRKQRAADAEAAPVIQEQNDLAASIKKMSDGMIESRDRIIEAMDDAFSLEDLADAIVQRANETKKEKERFLAKLRNVF